MFEPGRQLIFRLIYILLKKKLDIFREYIKKNFIKKFIRESTLSVGYPILFILKKNNEFRLYIDYRKLNNIIIKNKYLLFNIVELQDRFNKIIIFTKLNLRETYNLIRIKAGKK